MGIFYTINIMKNLMTISKSDYVKFTLDKIRLMCSIPSKFGVSNLILGAWDVVFLKMILN